MSDESDEDATRKLLPWNSSYRPTGRSRLDSLLIREHSYVELLETVCRITKSLRGRRIKVVNGLAVYCGAAAILKDTHLLGNEIVMTSPCI